MSDSLQKRIDFLVGCLPINHPARNPGSDGHGLLLAVAGSFHGMDHRIDVVLDKLRGEPEAVSLHAAAEAHLVAMGPCDDADEDGEESVCRSDDCTYCNLARATQPGVYLPAGPSLSSLVAAIKEAEETKPVCTFCEMPEDMAHHQDTNAKGYHPFNMGVPA